MKNMDFCATNTNSSFHLFQHCCFFKGSALVMVFPSTTGDSVGKHGLDCLERCWEGRWWYHSCYQQKFLQLSAVKHADLDAVRNKRPDVMDWPDGVPIFWKNAR